MKQKKSKPQTIFAAVEPTGKNRNGETVYELRDWRGGKIYAKGTIHTVFDVAEKLWSGHVRQQNASPGKWMILERAE